MPLSPKCFRECMFMRYFMNDYEMKKCLNRCQVLDSNNKKMNHTIQQEFTPNNKSDGATKSK